MISPSPLTTAPTPRPPSRATDSRTLIVLARPGLLLTVDWDSSPGRYPEGRRGPRIGMKSGWRWWVRVGEGRDAVIVRSVGWYTTALRAAEAGRRWVKGDGGVGVEVIVG